jgi:NADPH:quinone reductase-like Zn-dependent oxidoreductase
MKALIYRKFGSPDVLEWTDEWPEPAASRGQVVVRIEAGSVNPKDVLLRKGKFSKTLARDPLPRGTGLDMAGEVAAVGPGVSGFAVGDRVFGMTNRFCGGTHAELTGFHPREICRAPASLAAEQAAAIPLAALTALQALRDCCPPGPGKTVLINGASGGVGHFAVQIAKILGAGVHAVCGRDNTDFVKSLGADSVHCYTDQPANSIDAPFDVVFDVFGNFRRKHFRRQLGRQGVFISTVPGRATIAGEILARTRLAQRSRLVLVRSRTADLQQLANWCDEERLRPHVDRIYPVDQAADAHRHIETRHTRGKVVIRFRAGS